MATRSVELILAKQLAGLLVSPIMLFDAGGTMVYFNEPMEALLGRSFGVTGPMVRGEWSAAFHFEDLEGGDLEASETPLSAAFNGGQAGQITCWIVGIAGTRAKIRLTTVPIEGAGDVHHGVLAIITQVN
jgi:hypothetical protein